MNPTYHFDKAFLSSDQRAQLEFVSIQAGLNDNDFFHDNGFHIMKKSGIHKISLWINAKVEIYPVYVRPLYSAVRGVFTSSNIIKDAGFLKYYETFGSAQTDNCKNSTYLLEMAENRCRSRGILSLVGLHQRGFYSEFENPTEIIDKLNIESGLFGLLQLLVEGSTFSREEKDEMHKDIINDMTIQRAKQMVSYLEAHQKITGLDHFPRNQTEISQAVNYQISKDRDEE